MKHIRRTNPLLLSYLSRLSNDGNKDIYKAKHKSIVEDRLEKFLADNTTGLVPTPFTTQQFL